MAICDLDVAPAFERSKHHEEIGGAIALILVIETGRASRFHRDLHARFGNELLRGLVEANQRTIAVAWPRIDGQHVFHSGYERAVGLRRDDPVLAAMGLKSVFLSARPIVLSLARSTMPSSTKLFSNNRKVQRARPVGGLEQAKAISLASFSPSKIRAMAGIARGLRLNTASKPSSTSCLLLNPTWATFDTQLKDVQEAARAVGQQIQVLRANTEREIDAAFDTAKEVRASAMMVGPSTFFTVRREQIVGLAARDALPTIHGQREFMAVGGLMSYGTSFTEAYRQAGVYSGKILGGARPAELPVVQSAKFELLINLKVAKSLGLTIPPGVLAIADEVFE